MQDPLEYLFQVGQCDMHIAEPNRLFRDYTVWLVAGWFSRCELLFPPLGLQAFSWDCGRCWCIPAGWHGSHQWTGGSRRRPQSLWVLWHRHNHHTQNSARASVWHDLLQKRWTVNLVSFVWRRGVEVWAWNIWSSEGCTSKMHKLTLIVYNRSMN